jgi:hypothetical protein
MGSEQIRLIGSYNQIFRGDPIVHLWGENEMYAMMQSGWPYCFFLDSNEFALEDYQKTGVLDDEMNVTIQFDNITIVGKYDRVKEGWLFRAEQPAGQDEIDETIVSIKWGGT